MLAGFESLLRGSTVSQASSACLDRDQECNFLEGLSSIFFFFLLFRAEPVAYGRAELELQLPAYIAATAMKDLSHICTSVT